MLKQTVKNELLNKNIKNCTLIVGISGGADSISLLYILNDLSKNFGLKIIVAHLDHQIRKNSDKDCKFVESIAKKLNLTFESKKINVKQVSKKNKKNLEEASREERYKFFNELQEKYKAKHIFLAHHLNDSLETAIFNFTRGSFLHFLTGINESDIIIRPFLSIKKEQILKYCKKNKIKFVEDETNKDTKYSRNKIRHQIVTKLKEINPNLEKSFLENQNSWKELINYLEKEAEKCISNQKPAQKTIIDTKKFLKLPTTIQKTAINLAIKKISNIPLSSKNLNEIISLIKSKKTGKKKIYHKDILVQLTYKGISISKQKNSSKKATTPKKQTFTKKIINNSPTLNLKSDKNSIYLNYDKLKNCKIKIKTFQNGDRFQPLGLKGKSKKLQDFFIDKKIDSNKRRQIPLLTINNNEIISVDSLEISEKYKITKKTDKILKISFKK